MSDENAVEEVEASDEVVEETPAPTLEEGFIEVSAKIGKDGVVHTIAYDFGKDLDSAVEKFGAQVVFTNFRSNGKVGLQASMRSYIKRGLDVNALATAWKPGVTLERAAADPKEAMKAVFKNMDDTERAEFLQSLRDSI